MYQAYRVSISLVKYKQCNKAIIPNSRREDVTITVLLVMLCCAAYAQVNRLYIYIYIYIVFGCFPVSYFTYIVCTFIGKWIRGHGIKQFTKLVVAVATVGMIRTCEAPYASPYFYQQIFTHFHSFQSWTNVGSHHRRILLWQGLMAPISFICKQQMGNDFHFIGYINRMMRPSKLSIRWFRQQKGVSGILKLWKRLRIGQKSFGHGIYSLHLVYVRLSAYTGINPRAASQYHAQPKAKRGITVLCVDKFPHPWKQTMGN